MPVIAVVLLLLSFFPTQAQAACKANEESATGDLLTKIRGYQKPGETPIAEGTCIPKNDPSLGGQARAAHEYLIKEVRKCPTKNSAAPPTDPQRINKINAPFAICAARFFAALKAQGKEACISSAYRDGPNGENARAGGANNSNHTKGLAIDINPGANTTWTDLYKFIHGNKSFGLCLPHYSWDKPHMVPAGIPGMGESQMCASQHQITKLCDGVTFDPNSIRDLSNIQTAAPSSQTPLASVLRGAACFLNPQSCQTQSMVPQQIPQQQIPQQYPQQYAQPTQNNTINPTQPGTQPTTGSSGSINPTTGNYDDGSLVSDKIYAAEDPCKNNKSAATDLLNALATSKVDPCSATPTPAIADNDKIKITNNANIQDKATLAPGEKSTGGSVIRYLGPGGPVRLDPTSQNTFTSQDLRNTPVSYTPQSTSFTAQTLSTLYEALSRLLVILTPFRGQLPYHGE